MVSQDFFLIKMDDSQKYEGKKINAFQSEVCVITNDKLTSVSHLYLNLEVLWRLAFTQGSFLSKKEVCLTEQRWSCLCFFITAPHTFTFTSPIFRRYRLNLWSLTQERSCWSQMTLNECQLCVHTGNLLRRTRSFFPSFHAVGWCGWQEQ